jgi:biotin transporter BioY
MQLYSLNLSLVPKLILISSKTLPNSLTLFSRDSTLLTTSLRITWVSLPVVAICGGYIIGFIFSAPLMSLLKRWYLGKSRKLNELMFTEYLILLLLSLIAALPTYTLGFLVFACHALGSEKLFSWALKVASSMGISLDSKLLTLFIASVLAFIPQDILMDHVIALILARYIYEIALYRGFDLS